MMLDLAEAHRRQYAEFHPRFHRPAAAARDAQRPFFEKLISDDSCIVLVSESDEPKRGMLAGAGLSAVSEWFQREL